MKKIKNLGDNPYLNAKEEWLERYGTYIKQAKNWRFFALLSLILAFVSLWGNIMQAQQIKVVPYIVEVDKLGRFNVVNRAENIKTTPEKLIQSVIGSVITDWRTVTADIELQKNMVQRLSYFFAGSAQGVLKEWYGKNNPYEVAKTGKLVHIELKSLPLKLSENSYRIEWTETVRNHSGVTLSSENFEATVTVQISPPNNEQALIINPVGVYITALSTSKIFRSKQ